MNLHWDAFLMQILRPAILVILKIQKDETELWNPKYISLLRRLIFYIPEIYPQLEKVDFFLDDDVVKKDLPSLFSVDLHENVDGAVETCV